MDKDRIKKILIHIFIWFAPSSTPIYIVLREWWGYELWISYFIACLIPCIIAYPIEKYVMERKEHKRKITAKRIK